MKPARGVPRSRARDAAGYSEEGSLGMLMPIVVILAAGVLVAALADAASREGRGDKEALFWIGISLIALPAVGRLCSSDASRRERVWLALAFGLSMYLVKVMYSPSALAFSDEFVHFRSVANDVHSGHLFTFNPLLPEAARYPGLGDVTGGLVRLTGVPIAIAGFIVIGCARLVLMLALFFVSERLSGSSRVAGIACFVYAANPNFLYWSSQVSYESLALPLVVFTLYLLARRSDGARRASWLACISILAVVVTHHLSSYFLAAILVSWTCVVLWRRVRLDRREEYFPLGPATLAVLAIGAWLSLAAPVTGQYLGSIASSTGEGLFNVLTGASAARKLFANGVQLPPFWERVLSIAAVGATLIVLAYAAIVIWRRRKDHPLMLAPLLLALIYPVLLPLRFIGSAAETANRSAEFLFLGVAVVFAFAVEFRSRRTRHRRASTVAAVGLCALVVFGGIAVAWQYAERLPQDPSARRAPYELNAQAVAADRWAAAELGPGHRFASDFLDHLGIGTYGDQRPLYAPVDGPSAWEVLAPAKVEGDVRRAIRRGGLEYVMIERKLSLGIPSSGWYFDKGEPQAGKYRSPIASATLGKFDRAPGVSRLYDNGEQQIYAVAALR